MRIQDGLKYNEGDFFLITLAAVIIFGVNFGVFVPLCILLEKMRRW